MIFFFNLYTYNIYYYLSLTNFAFIYFHSDKCGNTIILFIFLISSLYMFWIRTIIIVLKLKKKGEKIEGRGHRVNPPVL